MPFILSSYLPVLNGAARGGEQLDEALSQIHRAVMVLKMHADEYRSRLDQ